MSAPSAPERRVVRLDASDPLVIERFERAFYQGFAHLTHNRLIRSLWIWDTEQGRLRTRIPYADQALWGRFTGERFDGGVSVNLRPAVLQSAAFGFAVPPELEPAAAEGRVCEFMACFVIEDNSLSGAFALWNGLFEALRDAGFTHALATTAPKILPLYRRIGGIVIAEASIEGEVRYFLRFDLAHTTRWMARVAPVGAAAELSRPRYLVMPPPAPEQALGLVDQELGLLLGRLVVAMGIARGDGDEGFDLELRRRASSAVRQAVQKYLAHILGAELPPEWRASFAQREKRLLSMDALEEAAFGFAGIARTLSLPAVGTLVESLDLLLLTALRAWDGDEAERELLRDLTREDRSAALEKLRLGPSGPESEDGRAAFRTLAECFSRAVRMLHRLF